MFRLIIFTLCVFAMPAFAQVKVRDADTIVFKGTPIRLNGVDAPELGTRSGETAKRWLINFLREKQIDCDLNGVRTYDRWIGICYANDIDIGAAVIAAGHALDCRRYSGGRYRKLETAAAKSRLRRSRYC